MVVKGNWGNENTTETPKDETLFGVPIKVYPNDEAYKDKNWARINWFNLGGKTFQYKSDTNSRIPKYPYGENPQNRVLKETDSWEDYIVAIGEMYYGATYDPETKKFIKQPRVVALDNYQDIVSHMLGMVGIKKTGETPKGYGLDTVSKAISITKILDMSKIKPDTDFGETQETEQTKIERLEKKKFEEELAEYRKNAIIGGTSDTKADEHIGTLYRFMVITGTTGFPQQFTVGLKGLDKSKKIAYLKKQMTRFKKWAFTRETPPEWFDEMHETGFVPEEGEFKGETIKFEVTSKDVQENNVPLLPDIWKKRGYERNWVQGKSGEDQRKQATDAIRSFIAFSEPDSWKLDDQPPNTILSSKIKEPSKAHLGQDLTDEEIIVGMKFLETGEKWKWINSGYNEIKREDKEGKIEEIKVPNRIMIKDEDDIDPHYNTHLKIYKDWGKPYGRLAPANMFFRLALSGTGWRKAEALTCRNSEISKGAAKDEKSGFYFKKGKDEDDPEVLRVVFQTRKTERLGEKMAQHTSSIAPQSNKLIDSRHTIELVMEKHNQWKYADENSFVREEIPKDERTKNRPAEQYGKKWSRAKGQVSQVLIGLDNQFLPVNLIRAKTGGELTSKWSGKQLTAYLYVPLKEMYAVMRSGTGVSIRDNTKITEMRNADRLDLGKKKKIGKNTKEKDKWKIKVFPMDDFGWATSENPAQGFADEEGRMSQDSLRWNDPEKYWIKRPLHSVRHIFAQVWLRKTEWNFGLVSLVGHWKIIDTLKLHYGERDDDVALKQIIGLFAKSDDLAEQDRLAKALRKSLTIEDAKMTKEETTELSPSEKKLMGGEDSE